MRGAAATLGPGMSLLFCDPPERRCDVSCAGALCFGAVERVHRGTVFNAISKEQWLQLPPACMFAETNLSPASLLLMPPSSGCLLFRVFSSGYMHKQCNICTPPALDHNQPSSNTECIASFTRPLLLLLRQLPSLASRPLRRQPAAQLAPPVSPPSSWPPPVWAPSCCAPAACLRAGGG